MDASWRVNVRAQFLAARIVMPSMIAQGGGVILNTASNSGVFYDREMIAYTTSKHAVVAMTRQMSLDYARHNVRVNALCPGWVDTPFNEPFIAQMGGREAIETYVRNKIPMGRWASVEEIAEADPVPGLRPLILHDRPGAGDRRRRKHRLLTKCRTEAGAEPLAQSLPAPPPLPSCRISFKRRRKRRETEGFAV